MNDEVSESVEKIIVQTSERMMGSAVMKYKDSVVGCGFPGNVGRGGMSFKTFRDSATKETRNVPQASDKPSDLACRGTLACQHRTKQQWNAQDPDKGSRVIAMVDS